MKSEFITIKKNIKLLEKKHGIKVSTTIQHYNSITVAIMAAPYDVTFTEDYVQLNPYYLKESKELTRYGQEIMQEILEIVRAEHWDKSDSQTDYFHCAFYYNLHIGKWDRDFKLIEEMKKAA